MVEPLPASAEPGADGLVRTTGTVLALKALSAALVGVVAIVTARQLGPSGRGALVLLYAVASFALIACGMGVNVAAKVHLVSPTSSVTTSDYLGLSTALSALQVVVCLLLAITLLPRVHVHLTPAEFLVFGALGGSMLAQYLLLELLVAHGFIAVAATVDAAGSGVQLAIVLGLVAAGTRSFIPFVSALAIANALQILLTLVVIKRVGLPIMPTYQRSHWAALLQTGLPGIVVGLAQVLTFRLDRYLIGLLLTPGAVGVYSVSATAPELIRLLPLALSQPVIHRLASGAAVPEHFRRTRLQCLAVLAAIVVLGAVLAPFAVRELFGPAYRGAVTPLRVLLLAEFGIAIFYLDGGALTAVDRVRSAATAATVALVLVVVGDLILIPRYGILGAAWASVAAYSTMGVTAHVLLRRHQSARRASS